MQQPQSSNIGLIIIVVAVVVCLLGIVYILNSSPAPATAPATTTPTPTPSPASASSTNSASAPVDTGITYTSNPAKVGTGTKVSPGVAICPAGSSNNAMDNPFFKKFFTTKGGQLPLGLANIMHGTCHTTSDSIDLLKAGVTGIKCSVGGLVTDENGKQLCVVCPSGTTQISADKYCMA